MIRLEPAVTVTHRMVRVEPAVTVTRGWFGWSQRSQ